VAKADKRRSAQRSPIMIEGALVFALTRAELDVVKLVSEGLGNKEVAARLFVSPRTVQAHLTHVYTKLGLTSRVQLAQEASRHG
jgi:DNA-binding CsgD family transcriptional regulator